MAGLQLNPFGLLPGAEGYISSISIQSNGGIVVYTPDAGNAIGIATSLSPLAATRIAGGQGSVGGAGGQCIRLITG